MENKYVKKSEGVKSKYVIGQLGGKNFGYGDPPYVYEPRRPYPINDPNPPPSY